MKKSTSAPRKAVISLSLVLALDQVFAGLELALGLLLPILVMDTLFLL